MPSFVLGNTLRKLAKHLLGGGVNYIVSGKFRLSEKVL